MPLEKQVTSLELSIKLKELRVKQDGLFYWGYCNEEDKWELVYIDEDARDSDYHYTNYKYRISAFTVAELGEMLPYTALGAYLMVFKGNDDFSCAYGYEKTIHAKTEADARAKMLIYLIENNLITL